MASKQPFKFINVKQTLLTWSIRLNKFFKHRLLSKRKNALIITDDTDSCLTSIDKFYLIDKASNQFLKVNNTLKDNKEGIKNSQTTFQKQLLKNMYKTWEITQLKSIMSLQKQSNKLHPPKKQQNPVAQEKALQNSESQKEPSTILLQNFNDKDNITNLEKNFITKKQYFDAIIVLPEKDENLQHFPQIDDQRIATDFIQTFQQKIMKNIVAYRLAHKFLNTSGTFLLSASQYDFAKKSDEKEDKKKSNQAKNSQDVQYVNKRPPASKQIVDNTICYLGVLVGDRDYTDLNSWTLVSLSEEASLQNPQYVAKMYYDWADGQQLPMPGSFSRFKRKVYEDKKELNFVQYL